MWVLLVNLGGGFDREVLPQRLTWLQGEAVESQTMEESPQNSKNSLKAWALIQMGCPHIIIVFSNTVVFHPLPKANTTFININDLILKFWCFCLRCVYFSYAQLFFEWLSEKDGYLSSTQTMPVLAKVGSLWEHSGVYLFPAAVPRRRAISIELSPLFCIFLLLNSCVWLEFLCIHMLWNSVPVFFWIFGIYQCFY